MSFDNILGRPATEKSWKQKAYKKLQRDGWVQGFACERAIGRDSDACCAGGAIAWAITGDPTNMYDPTLEVTQAAIKEFAEFVDAPSLSPGYAHYWRVADWNDEKGRTKEEVLDAFKRLVETEGSR